MKKSMAKLFVFASILIVGVMTGCDKGAQEQEQTVDLYSKITPASENAGLYFDTEYKETKLYLYRVTERYMWLAYNDSGEIGMIRAEKDSGDSYEVIVSYRTDEESYSEYDFSQMGDYSAGIAFQLKGDKVYVRPDTDAAFFEFKGSLKLAEKAQEMKAYDLTKCLGEFYATRKEFYRDGAGNSEIGKDSSSDQVSYVQVKAPDKWKDRQQNLKYCIGGITFFSTEEECDKAFGTPEVKEDGTRIYQYKDKYEIAIKYENQRMQEMGIYLGSREKAYQEYTEGDFTLRGGNLVKWNHAFTKEGKLEFPKTAVAVKADALTIVDEYDEEGFPHIERDKSEFKKASIYIPKDMYLESNAFRGIASADITFEEGRTEIEPGAFRNMCLDSDDYKYPSPIRITLPKSITKLGECAFEQEASDLKLMLEVSLNEGITEIEANALYGLRVDLPSGVTRLGDRALNNWRPATDQGYILPEGLKEIGNYCISMNSDGAQKFVLPASLEKVGFCPLDIFYSDGDSSHIGFSVADGNRLFKADEKGWLYSADGKTLYYVNSREEKITIPEGVEYLMTDEPTYSSKFIFPKSLKKNYKEDFPVDESES